MTVAFVLFIILGVWAVTKLIVGMIGAGMFTGALAATNPKDSAKMAKHGADCWGMAKIFTGGLFQLVIAVIGIIAIV